MKVGPFNGKHSALNNMYMIQGSALVYDTSTKSIYTQVAL